MNYFDTHCADCDVRVPATDDMRLPINGGVLCSRCAARREDDADAYERGCLQALDSGR
jgi:recombinational DNA repair protein (RecF pathway)